MKIFGARAEQYPVLIITSNDHHPVPSVPADDLYYTDIPTPLHTLSTQQLSKKHQICPDDRDALDCVLASSHCLS